MISNSNSQFAIRNSQTATRNPQLSLAHPFLKWAGGKTQLLEKFRAYYPRELKEGKIIKYFEPFLGGGAVFFDIIQNYPVKSAYLSDINLDLVMAYRAIQIDAPKLIRTLERYGREYKSLGDDDREAYYYDIRERFNKRRLKYHPIYSRERINPVARMIFLNRTCYNGLFRVNRYGAFNVPFGRYKNPKICDRENIERVSALLQDAEIIHGRFDVFTRMIKENSFVYFDPPYRPISRTSGFTSYSTFDFDEQAQIRLGEYFRMLNGETGAKLMLSNSDPSNWKKGDRFFEKLYKGFNIHRVTASRMINCKASRRGEIRELIITNY